MKEQNLLRHEGMRVTLLAALLASALCGCSAKVGMRPLPPTAKTPPERGLPAWLPPYTAEQRELLQPPDEPIQLPVARIFPDLDRFGYGGNHRMEDVEEGLLFIQMVGSILTESPRFYVILEVEPKLANPVVQYGPRGPTEPDPWHATRRDRDGIGQLVKLPVNAKAREEYDRGQALRQAKDLAAAQSAFESAAEHAPGHLAIELGLAQSLLANRALDAAEQAFHRVLSKDPTLSSAYTGLAEIHERRGDAQKAKKMIGEALAYHPSSQSAQVVAARLTADGIEKGRVPPFAIFLDVDSVGAIHVGATSTGPAQIYAGCRAILRFEPEVRAAIFHEPEQTPYYLSVVEEVVCLEAAIGQYIVEQAKGESPQDPNLEALARLAHQDGLSGYVMFEILGPHRPERARGAPTGLHRAMVKYIHNHVLNHENQEPEADGLYRAGGDWGLRGLGSRVVSAVIPSLQIGNGP